ncbi:MAG: PAS domain S-box protein [Anaerolineae bacterium]|nr:PAS domain S-box protein [Anaerolineae bacterium]
MAEQQHNDPFQTMIERNADGVLIVDRAETIRFANPAAEALLGRSRAELRGQVFGFPVIDGDKTEIDLWRSDHTFVSVDMRVVELVWENEPSYLISLRDITERKHAEQALARETAALQATLNSIGDAVISTDIQGRVIWMNPVAESLTGWTQTEAAGRLLDKVLQIINEETRSQTENPVARVLQEETIVKLANHTLLISRSGKEIPIADSAAPLFDAFGHITGVVLVFRDQTEERLNQRLMETRLSLIAYATNHSLDALLTQALDEIGALLDSPLGFYHFVDPDQNTVSLQQWSTHTLQHCAREHICSAERKYAHYDIAEAGVWANCVAEKKPVIHNDYAALPHKNGLPEGHVALARELAAPVLRDGKVVAVVGVGNKPADYTQKDADVLSYLADVTWEIVRQKQAEEALRESEEKHRTLFETMAQGVVYHDTSGAITSANPAALKILGLSMEQLLGRTSMDPRWRAVHEDGSDFPGETHPSMVALHTGQEVDDVVMGVFNPQLEAYRWIRIHATPQFAGGDRPRQVYTTFDDITERKQAEDALRESEEKFRSLVEQSYDGVFLMDEDARIVEWNPALEKIVGIDRADAIGRFAWDVQYQALQEEKQTNAMRTALKTALERFRETGEAPWLNTLHKAVVQRGDGTLRIAEQVAFPICTDKGFMMGTVFRDVTERQRMEQALHESAERLELALQGAALGAWDWHIPTGKTTFDERWAEMIGYTAGEITHHLSTWEALVHPDDLPVARERLNAHLEGKTGAYEAEFRMRHKSGKWIWVLDKGRVIERDANGVPLRACGTHLDITRRKQMEQALQDSLSMAQRRESETRQLLAASQAVLECHTFSEAARRIFDVARETTGAVSGYVAMMSQDGSENEVLFLESGGMPCAVDPALPMPIRGLRAAAYARGEVVYDNDFLTGPWAELLPPGHVAMHNVLFAPILAGDRVVGVMGLANKPVAGTGAQGFTEDDARMAGALGNMIAIALRRIQAEEALRASEARYRSLAENFPNGALFLFDASFRYLAADGKSLAQAGLVGEQIVGRTIAEVFPELWDVIRPHAEAALRGEESYYEVVYQGRIYANQALPITSDANQARQGLVVTQDITERKQAQEKIAEVNWALTEAERLAQMGNWTWYPGQHRARWSAGLLRIYGVDPADGPPMNDEQYLSHIHPDDHAVLEAALREAAETGYYECDYRIYRYDNEELRYHHARGELKPSKAGPIQFGIVIDVTERKQAEAALQESERRYRELFENSRDGFVVVDPQGQFIDANQAYCQMVGYTLDELRNTANFYEITPSRWHTWEREEIWKNRLLESGHSGIYEKEYIHKDGTVFPVEIRSYTVFDDEGDPRYLWGIVRDITERKRAEETVRASEERFRDVVSSIPGAVFQFVRHPEGTLEVPFMSEGAGALFNRPVAELLDSTRLFDDVNPADIPALWASIEASAQSMTPWRQEFRVELAPELTRWLRGVSMPRRLPDGSICWTGMLLDVTENQEAQRKVEQYAQELERSNQELEHFAYVISHDLQEPARTVLSYLQLLVRRYHGALDDKADAFIRFAIDGAQRMQDMIRALLDLSRVESRGQSFKPTDCERVWEMTCRALHHTIQQSGAHITHDPLPVVLADPDQLGQVFQNLLANAIKFRREDTPSRIHISARLTESPAGKRWEFSVRDNGIGIPPEQAGRLFQIFQRLHTQEEYPGVGIGLALCKRIVERHDGEIWIEAESSQGATIKFTLPDRELPNIRSEPNHAQ